MRKQKTSYEIKKGSFEYQKTFYKLKKKYSKEPEDIL